MIGPAPALPEQLAFPDLIVPELPREATLRERFDAFNAANPGVYFELRRLALEMVRHGRKRVGIAACFEILRWSAMQTRGDDGWKLNNSHRAFYARLLADSEPELATAFELRTQRSLIRGRDGQPYGQGTNG